jgi:hypothetical protein
MPIVSFTQAALDLGMKSRSTLYRLKDSELSRYIRPPARPGGNPVPLPSGAAPAKSATGGFTTGTTGTASRLRYGSAKPCGSARSTRFSGWRPDDTPVSELPNLRLVLGGPVAAVISDGLAVRRMDAAGRTIPTWS